MCECPLGAHSADLQARQTDRERLEVDLLARATVRLGFTTYAAMENAVLFAGMDKRQITTYLLTGVTS